MNEMVLSTSSNEINRKSIVFQALHPPPASSQSALEYDKIRNTFVPRKKGLLVLVVGCSMTIGPDKTNLPPTTSSGNRAQKIAP